MGTAHRCLARLDMEVVAPCGAQSLTEQRSPGSRSRVRETVARRGSSSSRRVAVQGSIGVRRAEGVVTSLLCDVVGSTGAWESDVPGACSRRHVAKRSRNGVLRAPIAAPTRRGGGHGTDGGARDLPGGPAWSSRCQVTSLARGATVGPWPRVRGRGRGCCWSRRCWQSWSWWCPAARRGRVRA